MQPALQLMPQPHAQLVCFELWLWHRLHKGRIIGLPSCEAMPFSALLAGQDPVPELLGWSRCHTRAYAT